MASNLAGNYTGEGLRKVSSGDQKEKETAFKNSQRQLRVPSVDAILNRSSHNATAGYEPLREQAGTWCKGTWLPPAPVWKVEVKMTPEVLLYAGFLLLGPKGGRGVFHTQDGSGRIVQVLRLKQWFPNSLLMPPPCISGHIPTAPPLPHTYTHFV